MRTLLALALLVAAGSAGAAEPQTTQPSEAWGTLTVLGAELAPGESRRLSLVASESFAGSTLRTPVLVARGRRPGPTVCLTAGIHGDELNGIEIVRRVLEETDPEALHGTLIAIPIVNLHGFRRSSRYLPDRRDLNRYFPGQPRGSSASRIAHAVFDGVVRGCNAVLDFHTGSFHRTNIPQVRADLSNPEVFDLARRFAGAIVVNNPGISGTLRRAAVEAGIPAITYEAGEPMRFRRDEVERGVRGVRGVLNSIGMIDEKPEKSDPQHIYYQARWIRADDGGILLSRVELGQRVGKGEVLGAVTDPISNERSYIHSPYPGRVIGMALDQVVIPGFAAYHIGIETAHVETGLPEPAALGVVDSPDEEPGDNIHLEVDERPE